MSLLLTLSLFTAGILLLIKGGDLFVDSSVWISEVSGISRAVIGATLVSFATTAPEYTVSLLAVLKGSNDLSVGNAVGSLIANLGLAFALIAIFTPGKISDKHFGTKSSIMILAAALLLACCINGKVSAFEGFLLLAVFICSMLINIRSSRAQEENRSSRRPADVRGSIINILKFFAGVGAIILGSKFVVDNGQIIARVMGVSEAVIGLTVIAVGTSLPEIVTSISAIVKKENALSIGNIVGANILDTTLILATGGFVSANGLAVSRLTWTFDLPVSLLLMCLAAIPTMIGKQIYRWQGIVMMAIYAGYLFVLFK